MLAASGPINWFWFTVGFFLVAAFAWTRPLTVTDFENRRLARNVPAQVFFTLLYCLMFLTLTAAFHYGGKALQAVIGGLTYIDWLNQMFQARPGYAPAYAPLLALAVMGWFQSQSTLREIERTCLVYAYSQRYMHNDVVDLSQHLQNCAFDQTEDERAKDRKVLERLNIFLTDKERLPGDLRVVSDWRKVETLLRYLAAWRAEGKIVLNEEEVGQLGEVEAAHARKTELAMSIIRMLDHVGQSTSDTERFDAVRDLLAEARRTDPRSRPEVEARIEHAIEAKMPVSREQPIFISNDRLLALIGQVQGYFEEEYRILLRQATELTAKSIVHAGERAPDRLSTLKRAGFLGLGRIVSISFNRILWVFFAVLAASFLMFLARHWMTGGFGGQSKEAMQRFMMMIGFFSLTTALAAIVGAAVGSTRSLAQAPRIPWRAYLGAGLVSVALFFTVHMARVMLMQEAERPPPAAESLIREPLGALRQAGALLLAGAGAETAATRPARAAPLTPQLTLRQSSPWAVIPFMMTVAICLLARMQGWPVIGPSISSFAPPGKLPPKNRNVRRLMERAADGIALGLVMVLALTVALKVIFPLLVTLVPWAGIVVPPRLAAMMQDTWLPVSITLVQFALGAFVGTLILRDVRRAAHARVVLTPAEPPPRLGLPRAAGRLPLPAPLPAE